MLIFAHPATHEHKRSAANTSKAISGVRITLEIVQISVAAFVRSTNGFSRFFIGKLLSEISLSTLPKFWR